ncbi:MAG: nicotinamide mononucleotide transporter [Clostridia bacterium]|nr:nicotinamide mononucleotide transporter [Clostridia bacterium]
MKNPFKELTKFEACLWSISTAIVILSFILSPQKDIMTLIASVVGTTSLIFIAKGLVIGQVLMVFFSLLYGVISYFSQYYGEMITYLGMSMPMAMLSVVSWIKHPYKNTKQVQINRMTRKQVLIMVALTIVVTGAFYFVLRKLNTSSLIVSTVSIATSFLAVYMCFMRSPYYALGYALNDIVLIVLWVIASIKEVSNMPMILCFLTFLANDIYGFVSWRRMQNQQNI